VKLYIACFAVTIIPVKAFDGCVDHVDYRDLQLVYN